MESLLPLLIFGFIIYSWVKKAGDFTDDQGRPLQVSDILQRMSEKQSQPGTKIPIRQRPKQIEPSRDNLFAEDKWRRQLFLVALSIGVVYLVYLVVI